MALNTRQANFIGHVRRLCADLEAAYDECFSLNQTFSEEFDTGKDNDLSTHVDDLAEWGLTFESLNKACGQLMDGVAKFWTNQAVATREYGRFARRVADE